MEIVQIGSVRMDENMNIIDEFKCFVKPMYNTICKHCSKVTGIKQHHVANTDTLDVCISRFLEWIGEDIANTNIYSWSNSDLIQLQSECMEKNIQDSRLEILFDNWVDFQKDFGGLLGYTWQMSLKNAMKAMDMPFEGAEHDALSDAKNTAHLIILSNKPDFEQKTQSIRMLFEPKEETFTTLGDFFPSNLVFDFQ